MGLPFPPFFPLRSRLGENGAVVRGGEGWRCQAGGGAGLSKKVGVQCREARREGWVVEKTEQTHEAHKSVSTVSKGPGFLAA